MAILLALLRSGETYLSDLCREAGTTPVRALGAIAGDGTTYRVEESLLSLGLVALVAGDEPRYGLTPLGAAVAAAYQREMLSTLTRAARVRT